MSKQELAKNWFWVLLDIALVIVIVLGVASIKSLWKYGQSVFPARTINVSAEGKVVVAPDIATLSFSVVTEGADPSVIQEKNTEKINKVIEFIKAEGIESKDIKTSGYNLNPVYEYDRSKQRSEIVRYSLTQTVIVKIRDFDKVGPIIAGLTPRGVNRISGLSFDIEDPDKFLNEARKEAFEKARAKAETMAAAVGVRVKRVITFNEYGGGYPIPVYERAVALGVGGDVAAPTPPTIEPGSQEVTVQVNVVYEIY
ncbi:MAG: SIMPL domain-containing protein [Candidatus Harrisonbacteria bacterium]|nr:SIMPL domain-containing protein [Candidatus Harrisonbacteria bacterium]